MLYKPPQQEQSHATYQIQLQHMVPRYRIERDCLRVTMIAEVPLHSATVTAASGLNLADHAEEIHLPHLETILIPQAAQH